MYRYISFIWNAQDARVTATLEKLTAQLNGREEVWNTAYESDGLRVMHTGEEKGRMQAYPLSTGREDTGGVVVGNLLHRERDPETIASNAKIGFSEANMIIRSVGRRLVEEYWGSYVAFFRDGRRNYVLVDPMGIFSCYKTTYQGVDIYFTYLPDVEAFPGVSFSADWPMLAKGLIYPNNRTVTPILNMTKILAGQCVMTSPDGTSIDQYWNPQKISQTDVMEDVEQAACFLRQTILSTVAALAAPYDGVIEMIGGLDSSILMASLGQVPTPLDFAGLNTYEEDPSGDERYYARQVAARVGVPLIEHQTHVGEMVFYDNDRVPLTPWPADHCIAPDYKAYPPARLKERGASAVFTGTGGDEILYCFGKNYAAIDYIKTHGLRPPLLRLIMEASRMQNRSVWSILPKILRGGLGRSRVDQTPVLPTSLLTKEIQENFPPDDPLHPWLEFRHGVTPGKIDHIEPLVYGQYRREDSVIPEHFYETVMPFLSQPIVEACLRIPLWVLLADGKGRGLARKAFQDLLPPEVTWRGSKTLSGRYFWDFTLENIDVFREVLMDGELVKAHIIDRVSLEKTLNRDHDIEQRDFSGIHAYLSAELWVRKMRGQKLGGILRSDVA